MSDVLAALDAIPHALVPAAIARLTARLLAAPPEPDDELLTPIETARMLRVHKRWTYAHARELGGVRLSGRQLRFPRRAVLRFIKRRADS